jgi:hypothetical protein
MAGPIQLALTLVYGQCTTSAVGSYTGHTNTKSPTHLALTPVYAQCTADAIGLYIGLGLLSHQ